MIHAVYNTTSRHIVSFVDSPIAQDLSTHPELASRAISTQPEFLQAGYQFDDAWNLVPRTQTQSQKLAAKIAEAEMYFGGLIQGGLVYGGKLYQIDSESQTQMAAMSLMALGSITDPVNNPWIDGFYWVAADNSQVPMGAPAMFAFGRAVASYVSFNILRLRTIKNAILAAQDQAGLDAIDVTAGYAS
jgi:hypothetical protein